MAGIVFYFENNNIDVYSGREVDLSAWNHLCKVADIKKAIIINRTNQKIIPFDADMDISIVTERPKLEGNITQLVIPTERKDGQSLWDFDHKTDWYLVGPSEGWRGDHIADNYIYIPQHHLGDAYGLIAASVVMYDRYRKLWQ